MFIGKLNNILSPVSYQLTKKDTHITPPALLSGNPFHEETLCVGWKELIGSGVDLHVTIPDGYLINTLVIRFGEASCPNCVCVYSGEKQSLLYRYSGETGLPITKKELVLPIDEMLSRFVIEITGEFSDISVSGIDIFGAQPDGPQLFPTADSLRTAGGSLPVARLQSWSADCLPGRQAARILEEKWEEVTGFALRSAENGSIRLMHDAAVPENGFRLGVTDSGVRILAGDLRGFVMGAETLIKLIREDAVPLCDIEDGPFLAFRGVHLYLPAKDQLDFTRRLIKYILSPCGYNHIILEMGAGMRFDSHPEINDAFLEAAENTRTGLWPPLPHWEVAGGKLLEKDDVRALVAYARSYGIEVIPEIQSLSHIQYLTQAYPEIAERSADGTAEEITDARLEDIPPSEFYAHSCCPSNPKTYAITFDLIDEIVEVVRPKEYVHMGHDEVYQIGICPLCSQKDPARLFAEDVTKYHDYLAAKGLKMMIWSDMLQPIGEHGKPKVTVAAVDMIPKDIVLMDFIWYFHPDKDIEDHLLPHGFRVIYGNMYSSHFPRYESRSRKDGILGGQLSAWVATSEDALAREGKLYDFLYTGQMMWSGSYSSHNRFAYDRLIRRMIPQLRSRLENTIYPSMQPDAVLSDIWNPGQFCPEAQPENRFPVDRTAHSLVFYHCASLPYRRLPWMEPEQIARYEVIYENGTREQIPITYGGNICHWNRRQGAPLPGMFYRHNGYTATWFCDGQEQRLPGGEIACAYRFEWINPHPEWTIRRIVLVPAEALETQVLLQRITAIAHPN